MRYFIIHGTGGTPDANWFPWLKEKLQDQGHEVIIPHFPGPEHQSLESWRDTFSHYENLITEDTIFIAHSVGPAFVLDILQRIPVQVKGCIFVAGFTGLLNHEYFDALNKTITDREFDWITIRQRSEQFYVVNAKDDPYVPYQKGIELAHDLHTQMISVEEGGHLNAEFGFTTFSQLLTYTFLLPLQKKIIINGEAGTLVGLKSVPWQPNGKAILMVHGFAVSKIEGGLFEENTKALLDEGYTVYRFDFRGCGESDGDYAEITLTKLKADLACILTYVREQRHETLGILTQSFGAATVLALQPTVDALVCLGAFAKPKEAFKDLFGEGYHPDGISKRIYPDGSVLEMGPAFWSDFDHYDLLKNVGELRVPSLCIHGKADVNIPLSYGYEVFEHLQAEKAFHSIDGADHTYRSSQQHRDEQIKKAREWFLRWL